MKNIQVQDKLLISIADENGMKQFCMSKQTTKFIFIGVLLAFGLVLISVIFMKLLMSEVNYIVTQKKDRLSSYHTTYQKNAMLKSLIQEKSTELSQVNNKIEELESIVSIQEGNSTKDFKPIDISNISKDHKMLILSLIPNGNPVKSFRGKISVSNRAHPLTYKKGVESGVDYLVDKGTPIYASADGVVVLTQENGKTGFGNLIKIAHSFGFSSMYAHLNTLEVKKGDFIQKGQLIGYSGDSGRSEGSRLYYELGFLDHNLNPFDYANWNLDNFEVVLKNDGSGIDWQNLIWAMEDIAKLQNFRISQVEITNDLVNR